MKDSEKEGNQEEGREGRDDYERVMMKDVSHCGKNVFLFVSSIHFASLPYPNNLVFILLFLLFSSHLFCRI